MLYVKYSETWLQRTYILRMNAYFYSKPVFNLFTKYATDASWFYQIKQIFVTTNQNFFCFLRTILHCTSVHICITSVKNFDVTNLRCIFFLIHENNMTLMLISMCTDYMFTKVRAYTSICLVTKTTLNIVKLAFMLIDIAQFPCGELKVAFWPVEATHQTVRSSLDTSFERW